MICDLLLLGQLVESIVEGGHYILVQVLANEKSVVDVIGLLLAITHITAVVYMQSTNNVNKLLYRSLLIKDSVPGMMSLT